MDYRWIIRVYKYIKKWSARVYKLLKKSVEKIIISPIFISFVVFVLASFIVVKLTISKVDSAYDKQFIRDVLIEAHGMLFDILIIGTFIFALHMLVEKRREKKRNIQKWLEEIDDFRGWKSEEAMHRIVGNIKRLNRNGFTKINLLGCNLIDANLNFANLKEAELNSVALIGAKLYLANLSGASLYNAELRGAVLDESNLKVANFYNADLTEASLYLAKLNEAKLDLAILKKANLELADLEGASLGGANLKQANLREANLKRVSLSVSRVLGIDFSKEKHEWRKTHLNLDEDQLEELYQQALNLGETNLDGADFEEANLQGARILKLEQFSNVKTLYKAKLDPKLEKQIKEKYPHLLEKPEKKEG